MLSNKSYMLELINLNLCNDCVRPSIVHTYVRRDKKGISDGKGEGTNG